MAKRIKIELPQVTKEELTKPIGQIAEECYTYYGAYVNNFRALANIADGCKTSYKRIKKQGIISVNKNIHLPSKNSKITTINSFS